MPTPQKSFFLFCIIQWNWNRTSCCSFFFNLFLWIEMSAKIVGDWRMWMVHLMHPSKQAEGRTQNEDCLPSILQVEMSFNRFWWHGSWDMQPSVWKAPVSLFEWVIKSLIQPINSRPKNPHHIWYMMYAFIQKQPINNYISIMDYHDY